MTSFEQVEILLVEDNPEDAEMMMRALRKSDLANRVKPVQFDVFLDTVAKIGLYRVLTNRAPQAP